MFNQSLNHSFRSACIQSNPMLYKFNLSPTEIKECDKYYILYWQASYLFSELIKSACQEIVREKIHFKVHFINGLTLDYLRFNSDAQVKVSFRRKKNTLFGIVLCSPILASVPSIPKI